MKYFFVNVRDRVTDECVTVGAMLSCYEARELIRILEKYNATDILIYSEEMK